jgi:hypothetical protein
MPAQLYSLNSPFWSVIAAGANFGPAESASGLNTTRKPAAGLP